MPNLASGTSAPATTITTTAETVAQNTGTVPVFLPAGSPQNIILRGGLWITTGAAVTAIQVKLRVGPNNTSTAQVSQTIQVPVIASTLQFVPFHFIDTAAVNLNNNGGYSITVTQVGATGNGTITAVDYEIATTP